MMTGGEPIPGQGGVQPSDGPRLPDGTLLGVAVTPEEADRRAAATQGAENSTESQNQALVSELLAKDQQLEGRLLTRFPTEDGKDILLMRHMEPMGTFGGKDHFDGAGVHSETGPFIARRDLVDHAKQIGDELRSGVQPKGGKFTWETLTHGFGGGKVTQNVESDSGFEIWKEALDASVKVAKEEMQVEAAKRRYLPKALEAVRSVQ